MADESESLPEKLSSQVKLLESQIIDINSQIKKGKKALKLIDQYNTIFTNLSSRVSDEKNGLDAILKLSRDISRQIKNERDQAKKIVFKANSDVLLLSKYLTEFNGITNKLNNEETGLKAVFKNATSTQLSLNAFKTECAKKIKEISKQVETANGYLERINKSYKDFIDLKKKLEDPKTGLKVILKDSKSNLNDIVAIKDQTDKIFTEASRIKDDSNKFLIEIEKLASLSQESSALILQYEKESLESKERIEQIYKLATDTGLATSFQARKRELGKGVRIWQTTLYVSVVLLFFAVWLIHNESLREGVLVYELFWFRLTLTLPIIFITMFSASQYSKERGLLERYAFKAATALALDSYTTLLTTKFSTAKDEILEFVLSSMSLIYREPWESTKASSMKMSIGNKLAEASAEIKESVKEDVAKGFQKVEKVFEKQIDSIREEPILSSEPVDK